MARTKFSELRKEVEARPGAKDRIAEKRAETLEEIRLYELRHEEALSQVEIAGRLDVTQGADLQARARRRRPRLDASQLPRSARRPTRARRRVRRRRPPCPGEPRQGLGGLAGCRRRGPVKEWSGGVGGARSAGRRQRLGFYSRFYSATRHRGIRPGSTR